MSFAISSLDSFGNISLIETNASTVDTLICISQNTHLSSVSQPHGGLVVFPNPTTGMVTFQARQKIISVEVFDATGKLIYKTRSDSNFLSIALDGQSPGLYFYYVKMATSVHRGKLLMQ